MKDAKSFNFTYRYIDDVLSINNPSFAQWLPSIYPPELEIKEITETTCTASFLDLHLEFDLKIINFPYLYAAISQHLLHMVFIFLN